MEELTGSVERVTYYSPENGYSVIRLRPKGRNVPGRNREGLVTIVGNLPQISPGEHLKLRGSWTKHAKHGLQFQVEHCQQTTPATLTGIQRYLGSGLIKGIGPKLAEAIVDHFGEETLDVIAEHPERLSEVEKIGPGRTRQMAQAWEEQKHIKEIMLFLHSHGVSTNLATKIYKTYQDESLQIVQNNPYQLARDIYGVGFKTADQLAQDLGLEPDHPSRLEAGLVYALNEQTNDGHVYLPEGELLQTASHLLAISAEDLKPALERLLADAEVVSDLLPSPAAGETTGVRAVRESPEPYRIPAVYLPPFYHSEIGLSRRLKSLLGAEPLSHQGVTAPNLDPTLSPQQREAVEVAISHPVSVLTGGPGTGKTTTIRSLISALEEGGKKYALASPTGRAAKRLSQATDRPASTIHRMLGYSPLEGFTHHHKNPLLIDFLVVDEASMLDVILGNHLLKALQPGTHLLLVGDVDQLPSVGAGDVLRDVIASGRVPINRLTTIFRQERDSHIISNAHRINKGQMPIFSKDSQDFFLFPAPDAENAGDWVESVVCERIPQKFGFHPQREIQVLSPMYRGAAGVNALNARLQAKLNPPHPKRPETSLYGQIFRVGDKVMQTKNDYDKHVYNGDIGYIARMDTVEKTLAVDFEGRHVQYEWVECEQLMHAYAVSVHKGQGSEFPAVVVPVITQHYMMLQRNLLYTAITRAEKLCVLVGNKKAIAIAVNNNKVAERYTALDWRLTL